jgi:hypothetical protein
MTIKLIRLEEMRTNLELHKFLILRCHLTSEGAMREGRRGERGKKRREREEEEKEKEEEGRRGERSAEIERSRLAYSNDRK